MPVNLYDELAEIPVIDTHEHLWDEAWRIENPGGWWSLFAHYGITSFTSAGMTADEGKVLFGRDASQAERWSIFQKYYPLCRNTAYVKAVEISIKSVYGIEGISLESMLELDFKIKGAVRKGFHRRVLREIANIDFCMVNCFDKDESGHRLPARITGDTELLRPDIIVDNLFYMNEYEDAVGFFTKLTGCPAETLNDWLRVIDKSFEIYAPHCAMVKCALAYGGSIPILSDAAPEVAEEQFKGRLAGRLSYLHTPELNGILMQRVLARAADWKMPVKFHTGLFSGGDWEFLDTVRSNIPDLCRLAIAHPENSIIAMHTGYPFGSELVAAVKQIRNLYADMCWTWIIDPASAADFLLRALTAAPVSKVMGFGGDYSLVENTVGHLSLARHGIAIVLERLVDSGYFSRAQALDAGKWLLRSSAERLLSKG